MLWWRHLVSNYLREAIHVNDNENKYLNKKNRVHLYLPKKKCLNFFLLMNFNFLQL